MIATNSVVMSIVRQVVLGLLTYVMTLSLTCFKDKKGLCIATVIVTVLLSAGLNAFAGYELYQLAEVQGVISRKGIVGIGLAAAALPALIMAVICDKEDVFISLFNVATQLFAIAFITTFSWYIAVKLLDSNVILELVIRAAAALLFALFLFLVCKKHMKRICVATEKKVQHFAFFMLPVLMCAVLFLVVFNSGLYKGASTLNDVLTILSIGVLAICVYAVTIFLLKTLITRSDEKIVSSLMRAQSKYWERQIEISKSNMESIKRQTHDLHHHNLVMMGYLQNNDILGAKNYLLSHEKRIDGAFVGDLCAHRAANSVLVVCSETAKKYNIACNVQAVIPAELKINQTELVGILANAFENAIEGCMRLPPAAPKSIEVKTNYTNGRLYIQIRNTCIDNIKFVNGKPVSNKITGGTGTSSIGYLTKMYNGMVDYSAKDGYFTTRIVINA